MKFHYDKTADALYVTVNDGSVAKTLEVSPRLVVDVNADGDIVGFEMLRYSEEHDIADLKKTLAKGIPLHVASTLQTTT